MQKLVIFSALLAISNGLFDHHFFNIKSNSVEIRRNKNSAFRSGFSNGTFETPVDHFSPTDDRVLQLLYRANVRHFEQNGPLFFYIQSGAEFDDDYAESGLIVDLARELNGSVIEYSSRYLGHNLRGFV